MQNITLITSVINTPNSPLSYSNIRSIFNKNDRFDHTKKTISSIRQKIPDNKIMIIECSLLTHDERQYFIDNTDYFFNIHDTNDQHLIERMFSLSKSMGEGTMTILALNYLLQNNINFDNIFKISGRYWLNDAYNYKLYNNELTCVHKINNDSTNAFTCFYKLSKCDAIAWLDFLINSEHDFTHCVGFEIIFAKFLKTINDVNFIEGVVGINGYVTVSGDYIDM
jgi:hypothetical protein